MIGTSEKCVARRGAPSWVAHDNDVRIIADDFYRIGQGFAFRRGAGAGVAKAENLTAQTHHSAIKAQFCTGARFEEKGCQDFTGAGILVWGRICVDGKSGVYDIDNLLQGEILRFVKVPQCCH